MPSAPKTAISPGKRRRATEGNGGRRFAATESKSKAKAKNKHRLPTPAVLPRKHRVAREGVRVIAFCAAFLIFVATIAAWRGREKNRRPLADNFDSLSLQDLAEKNEVPVPIDTDAVRESAVKNESITDSAKALSSSDAADVHTNHSQTGELAASAVNPDGLHIEAEKDLDLDGVPKGIVSNVSNAGPTSDEGTAQDEVAIHKAALPPVLEAADEELPERIEWYTREDLKGGLRPICRISKPCLLSNGGIALPEWMQNYESLIHLCGISAHSFYASSTGPAGVEHMRDLDADFALTIRPERFQEPTHQASVYLTEHILKSSFLFDAFGGVSKPPGHVSVQHCVATEAGKDCSVEGSLSPNFKPAIFVPKKIETGEKHLWSKQLVDMFGKAHGRQHPAMHLNASTILVSNHKNEKQGLGATCFRSILSADAMFRHLPAASLSQSSLFSEKNAIEKRPRTPSESSCSVSIGIADVQGAPNGMANAADFKDRIDQLAKVGIPGATVSVELVEFAPTTALEDHIKVMQKIDIFLAGSGDELSSMAYMRSPFKVFEVRQFGLKPNTHESLADVLGITHVSLQGNPQTEAFKMCLEGELTSIRKKDPIDGRRAPEWYEPLLKAWEAAESEFALSGTSGFDLLSADKTLNNYHARSCAQKQRTDFNLDEAARTVVLASKELCV